MSQVSASSPTQDNNIFDISISPSILAKPEFSSLISEDDILLDHIKGTSKPKIETVSSSILLTNLLSSQMSDGNTVISSTIENDVSSSNIKDIDQIFSHSHMVSYKLPRIKAQIVQAMQEKVDKDLNQIDAKLHAAASMAKTSTNPISSVERLISNVFGSVVDYVGLLTPEDISFYLGELNTILKEIPSSSFSQTESQILDSVQKLICKISDDPKYDTPECLTSLITLLCLIGRVRESSSGLIISLRCIIASHTADKCPTPQLFLPLIQSFSDPVQQMVSLPIQGAGTIISFCIQSNIFAILSSEKGLIKIAEEDTVIPLKIASDSFVAIADQKIVIFSQSSGSITIINNDNSVNNINLNSVITTSDKIIATGGDCDKLIVVLQGQNKAISTLTFLSPIFSSAPVTASIQAPATPMYILIDSPWIYCIFEDMGATRVAIHRDGTLSHSKSFEDVLPFPSFGNSYGISMNQVLTATSDSESIKIYSLPIKLRAQEPSSVVIPHCKASQFIDSISDLLHNVIERLNACIKFITQVKWPTPLPQFLSFFSSSPKVSIPYSLDLVRTALRSTSFSEEFRAGVISFGIRTLALLLYMDSLSLFSATDKQTNDMSSICLETRNLLSELVQSPIFASHSHVVDSFSALLLLPFHLVFFNCYSEVSKLIEIIPDTQKFVSSIQKFTNHEAILFFPKQFFENIPESICLSALSNLPMALKFLEVHEIKDNEEYICPFVNYVMGLATEQIRKTENGIQLPLVQSLIFALASIESSPMIASSAISQSHEFLLGLNDQFIGLDDIDVKLSKVQKVQYQITKYEETIESAHPYENNFKKQWKIEFKSARTIRLQFDRLCATETNRDVLTITSGSTNEQKHQLSGSAGNWPKFIVMDGNSVTFDFQTDGSVVDWGFKIIASADHFQRIDEFEIPINFLQLNFIYYIFGCLTSVSLNSIPISQKESDNRVLLESNLVQFRSSPAIKPNHHTALTRQLSVPSTSSTSHLRRGLSFDTSKPSAQPSDEIITGFVKDIISENPDQNGPAGKLLIFMYSTVKSQHNIRINEELSKTERYAIAALLTQLEFLTTAFNFSISLIAGKASSLSSIPPNLVSVWKAVYKLRLELYLSFQKSKAKPASNSLRDNFQRYNDEVRKKCTFLIDSEPILRIRASDKTTFDPEEIDSTLQELLSFLKSECLMEDVERIVEVRERRVLTRIRGFQFLVFLLNSEKILEFSLLSAMFPMSEKVGPAMNLSEVKSVRQNSIDLFSKIRSGVHKALIDAIVKNQDSTLYSFLLLNLLSSTTSDALSSAILEESACRLIKFSSLKQMKTNEDLVAFDVIWRYIIILALRAPTEPLVKLLAGLSIDSTNEFCQLNSITLLSVIQHSDLTRFISTEKIIELIEQSRPSVSAVLFQLLSKILIDNGFGTFNVKYRGVECGPKEFLRSIIVEIGKCICGKSLFVALASEQISFFRTILRPFSQVKAEVSNYISELFGTNDTFLSIGLYTIFGIEFINRHFSSYGIIAEKNLGGQISHITSLDPLNGIFRATSISNGNSISEFKDRFGLIASARVPVDPNDLALPEHFITKIPNIIAEAQKFFEKPQSDPISSILYCSFFGFLSLALQNKANSEALLKVASLDELSKFSLQSTEEKTYKPISELISQTSNLCASTSKYEGKEGRTFPFSLCFSDSQPDSFVPFYGGEANASFIKSNGSSLFMADNIITSSDLFYFELKFEEYNGGKTFIGFVNADSTTDHPCWYGIEFSKPEIVAPYLQSKTPAIEAELKKGDVVGCGFTRSELIFFINGKEIPISIPVLMANRFIPIVIIENSKINYNFGTKEFVANLISHPSFDITKDCLYGTEVNSQFDVFTPSDSMDLNSESYNSVIDRSISDIPLPLLPNSPAPFKPHQKATIQSSQFNAEFAIKGTVSGADPISFLVGSSVILHRKGVFDVKSSVQSFSESNSELERYDNYSATILSSSSTVKVMISNASLNNIIEVDPFFAEPIQSTFSLILNSAMDILEGDWTQLHLSSSAKILFKTARILSLKLMRASLLPLIDYIRANSLPMNSNPLPTILKVLICDFVKGSISMSTKDKYAKPDPSTFYFQKPEPHALYDLTYKHPAISSPIQKFIRSFVVSIASSDIITNIISGVVSSLSFVENSRSDDLFAFIPDSHRFESWSPMPSTTISYAPPQLPCIGYIPIIHSKMNPKDFSISLCSDGSSRLKISSTPKSDSDDLIITDQKTSIFLKLENPVNSNKICFGLFPIPTYVPDALINTHVCSFHLSLNILSWILSTECVSPSLQILLKHSLVPTLTSLLGSNSPYARILSFEVIAPILTRINWNQSDFTPQVKAAFDSISPNFSHLISDWKPLSMPAQQAVILSTLTNLLTLSMLQDLKPEELYDRYIAASDVSAESPVYEQIVSFTTILCAVGFDFPFPVRFPTFLIAKPWSLSAATLQKPNPTDEDKKAAFVANYQSFIAHAKLMESSWQPRFDEALRKLMRNQPGLASDAAFPVSEEFFASNLSLAHIPRQLLFARVSLFKDIDSKIANFAKVIEGESALKQLFNSCRSAIPTSFKLSAVEKVVLSNIDSPPERLNLKFNRFMAAKFKRFPNSSAKPMIDQVISQVSLQQIPALKRDSVPWHVDLLGEGATDAGGPGRDCFTEVSMEIMHPSLGLFIETPNKRSGSGPNQDLLIPNPKSTSKMAMDRYYYAGVLMSLCYTSKSPEPYRFVRFVWNALTFRPVMIEDIYEIDSNFHQLISSIEAFTGSNEEFQSTFGLTYTVQNSAGDVVELMPGGTQMVVTYEKRLDFVHRCQKLRIHEFDSQLEAVQRGFSLFFQRSVTCVLSPWEVELLICGDNTCPVEELQKLCNFTQCQTSDLLWKVLHTFTAEERMLFIKFSCGRMGLPPPGSKWSSNISISFSESSQPDALKPLPKAATCSSSVTIPMYQSEEWMAKKIRAAIIFGGDIDQDHNADISQVSGWFD